MRTYTRTARRCLPLLLLPLACSDPDGPSPIFDPPGAGADVFPGSVSDPSGSASSAWLSLPAAAKPMATGFRVRNRATGAVQTVLAANGGFDPVAVAAAVGDTLEVGIEQADTTITTFAMVPARKRPRVVRTTPAAGRVDVALNSVVTIVFSEPIDPAAIDAPLIQVRAGAVTVSGSVQRLDGSDVAVVWRPDAPLSASTAYELVLSPEIVDLAGDPIEGPLSVVFATSSGSGSGGLRAVLGPMREASAGADVTGPSVSVVGGAGQPVSGLWAIAHLQIVSGPPGATLYGEVWTRLPSGLGGFGTLWFEPAGEYRLTVSVAGDYEGEVSPAIGEPFTVGPPLAPAPVRLEPVSFEVIEYEANGTWQYAPRVRVSETLGLGPARVLRMEFAIAEAGDVAPLCSTSLTVGPNVTRDLLQEEVDWDYEWYFDFPTLGRLQGRDATGRIVYRDRTGTVDTLVVSGPIVEGTLPPTGPVKFYNVFPCSVAD
jgi:hypothetical protein